MMDEIITATHNVGENVQGNVPEGNWLFLLPGLDLTRVLFFGKPPPKVRAVLDRLARDVQVAETMAGIDGTFDLIHVVDTGAAPDWAGLRDLLAPHGVIYCEMRGRSPVRLPDGLRLLQDLWLTPAYGRMQTAVPVNDHATLRQFYAHDLFSPSVSQQTFDNWRRRLSRGKRASGGVTGGGGGGGKGIKKRLRAAVRKGQNAILFTLNHVEKRLLHPESLPSFMLRRGLLVSADEGSGSADQLPSYLQQVAADAPLDINAFRWGYAARGRYNSQKLLFFLFQPHEEKPSYVVKMVRSAGFNARLECEHDVLLRLQQDSIMPAGTLPEIVFFGYHQGLAILGQTAIVGAPFELRTTYTADCPYAHAAVQWLIDLSVKTVHDSDENLIDQLQTMVDRFNELYQPADDQQAFLHAQVEILRQNPPKLVFQHGDAGSWNLLITPDEQVAFLDWENASLQALPLWDLLYFLRSLSIAAGHQKNDLGNVDSFEQYFLQESPLSALISDSVARYVQQIGLDPQTVQPLFYLCWVFWALKQAALLEPKHLLSGFYWRSLQRCWAQPDAPTLRRLFSQHTR